MPNKTTMLTMPLYSVFGVIYEDEDRDPQPNEWHAAYSEDAASAQYRRMHPECTKIYADAVDPVYVDVPVQALFGLFRGALATMTDDEILALAGRRPQQTPVELIEPIGLEDRPMARSARA